MKHVIKTNVVEEVNFKEALHFALSTADCKLTARILLFEGYSSELLQDVVNYMRNIEGDSQSLEEIKAKRDSEAQEEFGYNYNGYR